ncbi:MAG: exostosin family protein [Acidobacteriota bacterium]|nr:exostosin family protein [Acidobacteriota bacterium]
MNLYLAAVDDSEALRLLHERASLSQAGHVLTQDPAAADMILLAGSFGSEPNRLLDHPLYRQFPDKCAVYTEDDNYLPLAPGVYCSSRTDEHARSGRTFSFAYLSRNGTFSNGFLPEGPVPEKKYLFSFQGGSTSLLRKKLFNLRFDRADVLVENTSTYYHWDLTQPDRQQRQQRYAETLAQSHFVLCPRGAGTGSIRFFEVMQAGVAPVLLADDYLLPDGVDWDSFLLRIPENQLGQLPELLEPYLPTSAERGRKAREAYLRHFAPELEFDAIVSLCQRSLQHGPPAEAAVRRAQRRMIASMRRRQRLRAVAKSLVLGTLRVLRIRNPYQMNER